LRVGGRFRFHRKAPVALEPRACLAEYDRGRRSLTLTASTQIPGILRDLLADLLGMPGHSVRVVAPDVGGGFGGKASVYPEEILVSVLACHLGRAVRWTGDRHEDLLSTSHGFDEIVDAELGLDEDGGILALATEVIGDVGAYSIYPWTAALEPIQVISFMPGPHRVPSYRGRVRAVATCKTPTGPYRGVGRPISTFVTERLIDMAARRLGTDPAAEGRLVGIGIATYAELTGIGSRISAAPGMPINTGTESATLRLDSTGAVTSSFGIAAHGQGLETTLAQVIADELGARIEDVRILQGDTAVVAHGTGSYASRSAVLAGGAAVLAARALNEKLVRAASHLLEASVADIQAADGRVFVVGTDHSLTLREIAKAVYSEIARMPKDAREEMEVTKVYDPYFGTTTSALELDSETCKVRLKRYLVAEDCGRIINPTRQRAL
jgi:carbon-monoxide dehydrogenase large subunit